MAGFDELEEKEDQSVKVTDINPTVDKKPSTPGNINKFMPSDDLGLTNVNLQERPINSIIRQIRGYPWKVNYYNNLVSSNDITTRLSNKLEISTQKYKLYKAITIYLEGTLDNQAQETKNLEITATVNTGFIPFIEDLVEVTMMNSRKALFRVSSVENMTYMQHDIYKATLKFYNYVDLLQDIYASLKDKVVNTLVEDKDYLVDYGAPVLLEEDLKLKQELKGKRLELIRLFYDTFLDSETKFLSLTATPYPDPVEIPLNTNYKIIDEYLNDFFRSLVTTDDDTRVLSVRKPSYIGFNKRARTILDLILNQDLSYINLIDKRLGFKAPRFSFEPTETQSAVYMNVDEIVDRDGGSTTTLSIYRRPDCEFSIEYPLILDINSKYYIFSERFYSGEKAGLTRFELMVLRFIEGEPVLHSEILPLIKSIRYWSKYEQFYVIPILLQMVNVLTKQTHSAI